ERQLNANGPDATIKITRGVASRANAYLTQEVDPLNGQVKRITENLRSQIKNYNTQLDQMQQRIDNKRKDLQAKFGRMEDQMAKLKSQESYMSGQLGQLGSGGSLVTKMLG
ncbi:MAG TPA: flagellar filament capping protein FliD, partial [bacterium]|nr:flagellar filament capping protein FliD [bacterium]